MEMSKNERAVGPRSRGFGAGMAALGVAAAVGIGVMAHGALADSRGDTTPSRAQTPAQHTSDGVKTHRQNGGHKGPRSDSGTLQLEDLPDRPDLGDWAPVEPTGKGSSLACVPTDVTQGLHAEASYERRFAARTATAEDTGPYAARIGETVLQFADQDAAEVAMQSVASWLQDCAGPDLVKHELLASETVEGRGDGFWETLLRSAEDFCGGTDCDAVWFDREGLVHVGDRLVLVSLAEVGGPLEPDGLAASMRDLVRIATVRAAG
jgi:hypothetical protein